MHITTLGIDLAKNVLQLHGVDAQALEEHALDVHIHSLRQKIEAHPANPTFLLTVRGVGYELQA